MISYREALYQVKKLDFVLHNNKSIILIQVFIYPLYPRVTVLRFLSLFVIFVLFMFVLFVAFLTFGDFVIFK